MGEKTWQTVQAIAADVMDRTGLRPHGQEDEAVQWVTARHGEDHIHLVAMLAARTAAHSWNARETI